MGWSSAFVRVVPSIAGLVLLAHACLYDYLSDDAFIFARYARNLVEGHGLVFNVGERVEGFTSVLWVFWLALLGALGIDYVWAMRGAGLACALGCVYLVHRLALRGAYGSGASWGAALLTATAAPLACWALAGLETSAFALAVLASLHVFRLEPTPRERSVEAAVVSGLTLIRPEALLVVPCFLLVRFFHVGLRGALRALATFLAPIATLGVLTIARFTYYGDILPNTARAKDAGGGQLEFGLFYLSSFFDDYGHALLWLAVFAFGLCARRDPVLQAAALIGSALMAAAVWVGGDGLGMYRFFVPVMPLFALLFSQGLAWLSSLVEHTRRGLWFRVALALLTLACAVTWAMPDREHPQYLVYDTQKRIEVPRWTEVGKWLAAHTPADASVACVPIGAIGYYSRRVVRDMVGLTDRHIAGVPSDPAIAFVGHRKHDGAYILSLKPTILLLGNVRVRKTPLALTDPDFGRPPSPAIRLRERDLFGPVLARDYEPRIAELPDGSFLHYYLRRHEAAR